MLSLTDEYIDILSQASCQLAKHRKSATIDRKDVQFAYETLFGRSLPGFSSDAIRLDQSRAARRPMSQQRAAKLKLVNDAKAAWRKEKEDAAKNAETAAIAAEAAKALAGNVVVNGTDGATPATTAMSATAPVTATVTAAGTPAGTGAATAPNGTMPATAATTGANTPLDAPAVIVSAPPLTVVV